MLKQVHIPVIAAFAALAAFSVSACNTVAGAGQDIRATGEAVTEGAQEAEDDITDGE